MGYFEPQERLYLRDTSTGLLVSEDQAGAARLQPLKTTDKWVDAKTFSKRTHALAFLKKMREAHQAHGRYEVCDIVLI